jgi:hypothetical protein
MSATLQFSKLFSVHFLISFCLRSTSSALVKRHLGGSNVPCGGHFGAPFCRRSSPCSTHPDPGEFELTILNDPQARHGFSSMVRPAHGLQDDINRL